MMNFTICLQSIPSEVVATVIHVTTLVHVSGVGTSVARVVRVSVVRRSLRVSVSWIAVSTTPWITLSWIELSRVTLSWIAVSRVIVSRIIVFIATSWIVVSVIPRRAHS